MYAIGSILISSSESLPESARETFNAVMALHKNLPDIALRLSEDQEARDNFTSLVRH